MQSNFHTYQQCLSVYSIWIKSNIDQDQKDYYKECTNWSFGTVGIGEIECNLYSLRTRQITDIFWIISLLLGELKFIIGIINSITIHLTQQENG